MTQELFIQLFGRVQGVNLRNQIKKFADQLRLTGYVENLRDGSVQIFAQGKESQLEELLAWCQKASFPVKVKGMKFEWREAEKEHKKFKIIKSKSIIRDQAKSFLNLGKEIINDQPINVPNHVVIIPDGNRRWAREKGYKPWVGHKANMNKERLEPLFNEATELGIKYVSFWAFSTENWTRDPKEVEMLLGMLRKGLKDLIKKKEKLDEYNVRLRHIGRKDRLPSDVISQFNFLEEYTKENDGLNLNACIDYGGRDDLVRAINQMIKEGVGEVTEEMISGYLDTKGVPDPDLIIRTSGERRTSGIMAYQSTYAELYFTNVYFPDFDAFQLRRAVLDYSARTRRFGGTAKKDLKGIDEKKLLDVDLK